LTTQGFGDTLLIMRGRTNEGRTESAACRASTQSKPDAISPRSSIEEVAERIDYKGSVLVRLEAEEIARAVQSLIDRGVESIAIALLWALANDTHEKELADFIRRHHPSVYLSLSSEVAPYLGEYERTATTAFNAYVGPKIAAYLRRLREVLQSKGLGREPLVMQAYGGVLGIDDTCKTAVGTIESGPAAIGCGLGGAGVTVSHAGLIRGYLNEECFLGGRMKLAKEPALEALKEKIAAPMNMTVAEAASGIYRITNSHMSDLIRRATVERGYDPREFTLFAFGGAAPVHAGRYAAERGINEVVVPLPASGHGAAGLVGSAVR